MARRGKAPKNESKQPRVADPTVLGLTILPGVELPEWAHSTRPSPAWGSPEGVGAFAGTPGFAQPIDAGFPADESFGYPVSTTFTEFVHQPHTNPQPAAPQVSVPPAMPEAPSFGIELAPGAYQGLAALTVPGSTMPSPGMPSPSMPSPGMPSPGMPYLGMEVPAQRSSDLQGHPLAPAAPSLAAPHAAPLSMTGAPQSAPSPFGSFVPLGDPVPSSSQPALGQSMFTTQMPATQMPAPQMPVQQMPVQQMPQGFAGAPAGQARPSFSHMGVPAPAAFAPQPGLDAYGAPTQYGQNPYENPYAQNPYGQTPYGQNPYGQNPYGTDLQPAQPEPDSESSSRGAHGAAPSGLKRLGVIAGAAAVIAAIGAGAMFMLGGSDPQQVQGDAAPSGSKTMPASIGSLVANDTPAGAAFLNQALGVPVRTSGLSVARAYSTAAGSPATTAASVSGIDGNPALIDSMRTAFVQRTGAKMGPPAVSGTTTCWAVARNAKVPAGSLCAWAEPGSVGRVFVMGQAPAQAATISAAVKSAS